MPGRSRYMIGGYSKDGIVCFISDNPLDPETWVLTIGNKVFFISKILFEIIAKPAP